MTIDAGLKPEGATERSPIAGAGAASGVDAGPKRYSVQRKIMGGGAFVAGRTVQRRRPGSECLLWPSSPNGGTERSSALKERERDDREDEIARLTSKVGEIAMDNALMEAKSPLARRRSRR